MKKKDFILKLIEDSSIEKDIPRFTAMEISKLTGIDRSNVSRYLNALTRENFLIKSDGRPVYFTLISKSNNSKPKIHNTKKSIGIVCVTGTEIGNKVKKIIENKLDSKAKIILIKSNVHNYENINEILNPYILENDFIALISTLPIHFKTVKYFSILDIVKREKLDEINKLI